MPASAIAGPVAADPNPTPTAEPRHGVSLRLKAAVLGLIFVIVPVILYDQFRAADRQKRQLVMDSVRDQSRIVASALTPLLTDSTQPDLPAISNELAHLHSEMTTIKLLFRPATGSQGFYYVGSAPPISNDALDAERLQLKEQGVLEWLEQSCSGAMPIALRYRAPDGHDELVISVEPIRAVTGCWAVVTTLSAAALPGLTLDVPYYDTPEIRFAGAIYLAMAVLTFTTLWSIWRGLIKFGERARAIRIKAAPVSSFRSRNDMPELAGVAEEFDRMVETLQDAARDLRQTAEDNAHAFKTPVAIIRQSLEPVERAIPPDHVRAHRALGLIQQSLDKLDGLLASARRLDEAAADLLEISRNDVDLSGLVNRVTSAYAELVRLRGMTLLTDIDPSITVRGDADMIETVIENILENAVSFSEHGATIRVTLKLRGDQASLSIADEGPGVPAGDLPRIFDRYFSSRDSAAASDEHAVHYGVGLWIVRRNILALGGQVSATNRDPHGLAVSILLPRRPRSPEL